MQAVHPYLNFYGNTEEAFNFYKSVFGGEFQAIMRLGEFEGQPGCETNAELSDDDKQKIMHVALPLGNGVMLMATDTLKALGRN